MKFQELADSFFTPACIISVVKKDAIGYDEIRIVACNQKYREQIARSAFAVSAAKIQQEFVADSLYEDYLRKDLGFEDICYRSAVAKTPVHTYIHLNNPDMWYDINALPLDYQDGCRCYCVYTMKPGSLAEFGISSAQSGNPSEDVLKTCIKLRGTTDFKKTMSEVIKDIRLICGAEVCTLMLVNTEAATCSVLATNLAENSTIKRVTQFKNFYDIAMSWVDMIGDGDCLIIQNEKEMEYVGVINNPWYLTLVEAGVDSVVLFPLKYNNEILGFIWATNFDTATTMRIKETLELTTFFISAEIAGHQMLDRLKYISYTDLLTGVRNRNAMNNRVNDIITGSESLPVPYGVIFADLNGLKRMNDTNGHTAGDLMLKKASILLQEFFDTDSIYRAGGDEFVIFVTGYTREKFEKTVEALRERANDPENVSFAVGKCFTETGCDIRTAMRLADENMYLDKKQYYDAHPEQSKR